MARTSQRGNVKKVCGCVKWKECAHPWYVDYREGKEIKDGKVRERGLRARLGPLVGREPKDFADAKTEARRAIVAWKDGRDARELLPGDWGSGGRWFESSHPDQFRVVNCGIVAE